MLTEESRIQKLTAVAKMYYLEDQNQNEIALQLGVSRPLVSKMLAEAKERGIVSIQIHDLLSGNSSLLETISERFHLQGGIIVPFSKSEELTNQLIVSNAVGFLSERWQNHQVIGLGWGSVIGEIVNKISGETALHYSGDVCPLIGNAPTSNRNYHTNELVRMLQEALGYMAHYLYTPVIVETLEEKAMYEKSQNGQEIMSYWKKLDIVVINLRNYPSIPDLATVARFGNQLQEKKAVGMLLGYYYDIHGNIIQSKDDYAIQIPFDYIKKAKQVIAIGSSRMKPAAIVGALHTGIITHLIINDRIANGVLSYAD